MNGKKSTLCASFCFGQNESKIKKSDKGRGKRCAVFSNAGGGLGLTCFKNVKLS